MVRPVSGSGDGPFLYILIYKYVIFIWENLVREVEDIILQNAR